MELFDKRFVHFMWDDELEGKEGFFSDDIETLRTYVESENLKDLSKQYYNTVRYSGNKFNPFNSERYCNFIFFYYDPNYKVKRAFYKEGKQIQVAYKGANNWVDCDEPEWVDGCQFRVKPEEKAVVAKRCSGCVHEHCSATKEPCVSCKPGKSKYEARLCKTCEHFDAEVDEEPCDSCIDEIGYPNWEPKKKEEKTWRPYESAAEMIVDFIDRFNAKCPSYCEPLVWVKDKATDARHLVTSFVPDSDNNDSYVVLLNSTFYFDELFKYYTYLDGSPCGMEVKE